MKNIDKIECLLKIIKNDVIETNILKIIYNLPNRKLQK